MWFYFYLLLNCFFNQGVVARHEAISRKHEITQYLFREMASCLAMTPYQPINLLTSQPKHHIGRGATLLRVVYVLWFLV
ncbi:hypothetical protein CAP35_13170 [Chitinophagaceae bacterium IBVUCB1]|nr:hypothetical protein CAP35_13170 [Chitinophagaceae bacterium IBVUCB1]